MALKRRRAEASKDAAVRFHPLTPISDTDHLQSEYAQILSKRIGQAKTAHDEARKRRASSMRH
jgi:small subunit ribosomal protein S6e